MDFFVIFVEEVVVKYTMDANIKVQEVTGKNIFRILYIFESKYLPQSVAQNDYRRI